MWGYGKSLKKSLHAVSQNLHQLCHILLTVSYAGCARHSVFLFVVDVVCVCPGFDARGAFSAGAKFPAVHDILQWATQRAQAELVVSDVQGRDCHQLLQEQIHAAGGYLLLHCTPSHANTASLISDTAFHMWMAPCSRGGGGGGGMSQKVTLGLPAQITLAQTHN